MRRLIAFAVLALAVPAVPVAAQPIDNAAEYRRCMELTRTKPDDAWETALAWQSLGGGEAARHCGAVALIALQKYEEAAARLEALAQDSRRDETIRAGMLAQAGQAWLLAHRSERAYGAVTAALKLLPADPDLLIDRAAILAETQRYTEALADLDAAVAAAPTRADALTFRATAHRLLEDHARARADVDAALKIDPHLPDALVERGILNRLAGDAAAARRDWMEVLRLSPEGPAADTARANIERLDVRR